ncbi:MAG: hypothetical protein WA840_04035 [Caulobacteraceae bacterium]
MLTFLFALALAQAEPSAVAAAAAVTPPVAEDGDVPKGAPTADYDFVAWCHGALSGHMALYTLVKPELKSIERPEEVADDEKADVEQMKAGREYLALYARALHTASKTHPKEMAARREKAEAEGEAIWDPAKSAEPRTRMWSWLLWDLPGRCEVAAKRLETRSGVLGAAFRTSADAPAADAKAPDAPASSTESLNAQTLKGQAPEAQAPAADAPRDGPKESPKSIDDALPAASAQPGGPQPDSPSSAPPLRGPQ